MSWKLKQQARNRLERETILPGAGYHGAGDIRACLIYPNTYAVGMSNLGFQAMHAVMNRGSLSCERAFLPDHADEAEWQRTQTRLFSLETQTPLAEFDLLGFSVSYELDYAGVARALLMAGIPPLSRDRSENHPLVIAGGPCITCNPEPLAELLDACVIGEGEEVITAVAAVLAEVSMARGASRAAVLEALAAVPGVYVPSLYEVSAEADAPAIPTPRGTAPTKVQRQWLHEVDRFAAATQILTPDTEFGDLFCVEISRGCGRACRFCVAGHMTRPPRARTPEQVLAQVRAALPQRRKVGLVGPALGDYPELEGLLASLGEMGAEVSASSLRADRLHSAPVLALAGSGETSVTIAPEAGTERLRFVLNKSIPDAAIEDAAANALAAGIRRVKLYLMIGLPTETDEDVDAIAALCRRLAEMPGMRQVTASVNPFIPKPGTPFQWCGMDPEKTLAAKLKRVRAALKGNAKIELGGISPREALIEAALARGDRRLAPVILAAAEGASWRAAFRQCGVDPEEYACRALTPGDPLPWRVIDLGIREEALRAEWEKAHATTGDNLLTPPCRVGVCHRCGVC